MGTNKKNQHVEEQQKDNPSRDPENDRSSQDSRKMPREIGGPKGPEPTRFGDWEKNGRCIDF